MSIVFGLLVVPQVFAQIRVISPSLRYHTRLSTISTPEQEASTLKALPVYISEAFMSLDCSYLAMYGVTLLSIAGIDRRGVGCVFFFYLAVMSFVFLHWGGYLK